MGSLDSTREESTHACLIPKKGGGGRLKIALVAGMFPMTTQGGSLLSQVNARAPLGSLAVRHRSRSDPKWYLSRMGEAITGNYIDSASETFQMAD